MEVVRICFNCESCGICDNAALGELSSIKELEKIATDVLQKCKEYRKKYNLEKTNEE